jgi:hypothetical protein
MMAVCYIKKEFPDRKELWDLVVQKAERWIASRVPDEEKRKELWELVENLWRGPPLVSKFLWKNWLDRRR